MCSNHPWFVMLYTYIMCSCFVALITSHVHHPNPNHVEPMGSDFGIWITIVTSMDLSKLTPGRFFVCNM